MTPPQAYVKAYGRTQEGGVFSMSEVPLKGQGSGDLRSAEPPVLVAQPLQPPLQIADLSGSALRGAALLCRPPALMWEHL